MCLLASLTISFNFSLFATMSLIVQLPIHFTSTLFPLVVLSGLHSIILLSSLNVPKPPYSLCFYISYYILFEHDLHFLILKFSLGVLYGPEILSPLSNCLSFSLPPLGRHMVSAAYDTIDFIVVLYILNLSFC